MKTMTRTALLTLALALTAFTASASAQASKEPPAKEPTDGFFDVPARPPGEEAEPWGLPAYMVTSAIGGLGIFTLCRSARRA
jgi:ABC-type glycerol-3-phosphate transport system substrate-binding protein